MTFLLDTNVVSELRKTEPHPAVNRWYRAVAAGEVYISVLVLGELAYGVELLRRRGDEAQAGRLEAWLTQLKAGFAERVLSVSTAVAERWGGLAAARPLSPVDALMAATAIEHDLTFVTREVESLADTGVRLLNPWAAS